MSNLKILSFILMLSVFIGCGGSTDSNTNTTTPSTTPSTTPTATTPAAIPDSEKPAQNAEGVWHYTCPNGCEGGGSSAVACEKCGTTLAHNSAYHNNGTTPTATTSSSNPISPILTSPAANNSALSSPAIGNAPIPNPAPRAPEPPQNAKGVWHYTCPSGCGGGGGSAIACAKCGTTLAHNTAYHQ